MGGKWDKYAVDSTASADSTAVAPQDNKWSQYATPAQPEEEKGYLRRVLDAQLAPYQRLITQVAPQFKRGNIVAGTLNAVNTAFQSAMAPLAGITELPGVKQVNENLVGPAMKGMANLAVEGAAVPFRQAGVPGLIQSQVPYSSYPSPKTRQETLNAATETLANTIPLALAPAVQGAAGAMASSVIPKDLPTNLYMKALKPRYSAKGGLPAMEEAARTGIREGIPVSKAGLEKGYALTDEVNGAISDVINRAQAAGSKVSVQEVANYVDQVAERFKNQANPQPDLELLDAVKQNFLNHPKAVDGMIDVADAQTIKQGTYQQLRNKYGEQATATVEGEKSIARGLKDKIAEAYPEINKLNARDGALINFTTELERTVARMSKQDPSLFRPIMEGGVIGGATGKLALGAGAAIFDRVFNNPGLKSRLAIALDRARNIGQGTSAEALVPKVVPDDIASVQKMVEGQGYTWKGVTRGKKSNLYFFEDPSQPGDMGKSTLAVRTKRGEVPTAEMFKQAAQKNLQKPWTKAQKGE